MDAAQDHARRSLLLPAARADAGRSDRMDGPREPDGEEPSCGVLSWRPAFLQRCAKAHVYTAAHGALGFCIRSVRSYFLGTLSTIEKRFQIPSRTAGLISSTFEVGVVGSVVALGYIGHRLHQPRIVVAGSVVIAAACLLIATPHFIFGAGEDAISLAAPGAPTHADYNVSAPLRNESLCGHVQGEDCDAEGGIGGVGSVALAATVILSLGLLVNGIGESTHFSIGLAYLDNNAHKDKAPILLASTQVIEMLGPMLGMYLAAYALAQYVDPSLKPSIDSSHPRWVGAWWIGWPILGALILVTALPIAFFPRELPCAARRRRERGEPSSQTSGRPTLQDFRRALGRMFSNKVLVLNTLSAVCLMLGYDGYGIFMPKYIETQFRKSASEASFITGSVGLAFTGVGMLASALVITRWQPSSRTVAAWNVLTELLDTCAHFSWGLLQCAPDDIQGARAADGSWNLTAACNAACGCGPEVKYSPICSLDGATTFYSPCHAGCIGSELLANGTKLFVGCACAPEGLAVEGACPVECSVNFTVFLVMRCIMTFLLASGRAGNALLVFRSVTEEDKTLSIAIAEFFLCILAYFPAPNIFGLLLDSACLVWGESCGRTGNCWLYDEKKMRYLLNFTAGSCLLAGTILDAGVWYYSKDLELYDKKTEHEKEEIPLEDGGGDGSGGGDGQHK